MTEFWNYRFEDTPDFIETFDELPLWSAQFGLLLLKHIELKHNLTVIDIGSGAGFPLFELAERLGPSGRYYGLDPWTNANNRAKTKIKNYGIDTIEIIEGSANTIPFQDNAVDLIVSNLGINNFDQPEAVFNECNRVLKPAGKLALTTNVNGHWKEFYTVFEETAQQLNRPEIVEKLIQQQEHRGSVESISTLFTGSGFAISKIVKDNFEMRFLDGTAFLNHHFVKVGWLGSWQGIIPKEEWPAVFTALEKNLNDCASKNNGLNLTVPMAFIEGTKLNG